MKPTQGGFEKSYVILKTACTIEKGILVSLVPTYADIGDVAAASQHRSMKIVTSALLSF